MTSLLPFAIGGISGVTATCIIQPMDMIKVSIQIISEQNAKNPENKSSTNPLVILKNIFKNEGIKGFYRGLDSAIARQVFYTTSRLGIYKTVTLHLKDIYNTKQLSFAQNAFCGAFSGMIGAMIGNPADLALVRMQADARLPLQQRRNYGNFFNSILRIVKDQGFLSLWKGATPTVIRATVLNLVMLSTYDSCKNIIQKYTDIKSNQHIRLAASAFSGLFTSLASLPFDNAKTKIQKMTKNEKGQYPYKNIFDAMNKTIKQQGFFKLWVGFPTFYFRIAPHVMITLIVQDYLTDLFIPKKRN